MATFTILSGTDDASETATAVATGAQTTANSLDATTDWVGFRFQTASAGPPQGATITAASLQVYVTSNSEDEPDVRFYGEKSVSSATFSGAVTSGISGRTKTTASADWSSTDLGSGTNQQFTVTFTNGTLAAIVQELVNQASWTTNSAITLLIQGNVAGSAEPTARDLTMRTYEYQGAGGTDPQGTYAAVLTLTWTGGGGATDTGERHIPRGVMRGVLRGVI